MALMTWTNDMSVGVGVLDQDHKRLVTILNELHDAMRAGRGKTVVDGVLDRLVNYTVEHFNREEKLFAQTSYPGAAEHRGEHEALKSQVAEIQRKSRAASGVNLTIEISNFLKAWLVNHIQGSDKKYRQHLNANGIS